MNSTTASYLATALWSSGDEFDSYDIDDLSPEIVENATLDLRNFFAAIAHIDINHDHDHEQIAHDFWLTRNHHGAGFWDGDYGKHGDELTNIAHQFRGIYLYIGDDGKIYQFSGV